MCRDLLPKALDQPAESQKYSDLENVTTFGVAARKARDNDPAVHTNQDMFSCGSLSARFSTERLVRSDGCNDYGFARWVCGLLLPRAGAWSSCLGHGAWVLATGAGVVCCVPAQLLSSSAWACLSKVQLGTSQGAGQFAATAAC